MLNKETLRYKIDGDAIKPTFIGSKGTLLDLSNQLLVFWQSKLQETRAVINDEITPYLYRARNLQVSRGLNKLIEDRSEFTEPANQKEFRERAFAISTAALSQPCADLREHHKQLAQQLNLSSKQLYDQLYADLPQASVLSKACDLSGTQLIQTYNMAQAQGLLLYASQVDVAIAETDTNFRRKLLKALRFQRLLAKIKQDDAGNLLLSVSGPSAVLDQHQRYGLQLALFLPAIACAGDWAVTAQVRCPHKERRNPVQLFLDKSSGLVGQNKFLGYVPEEIEVLIKTLGEKNPDWQCDDQAPLLVVDKGEIIAPDLRIQTDDNVHVIEFFHRWHALPLRRRLEQIKQGQAKQLLLGIDRSILKRKEFADLAGDPLLEERGFLFSNFPSPSAIRKCIKAQ